MPLQQLNHNLHGQKVEGLPSKLMSGCFLCNHLTKDEAHLQAHLEEEHDGQGSIVHDIPVQAWTSGSKAWRIHGISVDSINAHVVHKPIIDVETAEQVLELANVTGFQSIDDLFLVPQLRSELPFEAFGTVGRITLASHNLDHHTERWFRDLNGQIEQGNWPENFPGQELEVHVSAASRILARIYTTAWVLWRNHRYAEEVPIESRTARNRAVQATFSLLSPDMKDAREALHVLLWRETAADFQNTPGHDGTVRRALAALSRSLTKAVASDEEKPASFLLTLWAVWTKDSDTSR
ncbi:hypothetical protein CF319_g7376 [Tilletia indica]|nr:hypothetical protein CF319_g7376 [Tilletia indica]